MWLIFLGPIECIAYSKLESFDSQNWNRFDLLNDKNPNWKNPFFWSSRSTHDEFVGRIEFVSFSAAIFLPLFDVVKFMSEICILYIS